jgi:hypothetical protein
MKENVIDMKTQRKTKEAALEDAAGFERGTPPENVVTDRTFA